MWKEYTDMWKNSYLNINRAVILCKTRPQLPIFINRIALKCEFGRLPKVHASEAKAGRRMEFPILCGRVRTR